MKTKKLKVAFLITLLAINIYFLSAVVARFSHLADCKAISTQGHYYAFGYIDWLIQRKWIGGKVTFANPSPDYSTPNSHAKQAIWVKTNNSTDSWVETGYSKGWVLDSNKRTLYTARVSPSGIYVNYMVTSVPVGQPGKTHTYKILYSNGRWKVYIDGVYVAYSIQRPYAREIDVGLESLSLNNKCFKVHPYNMEYYYENQGWYSFGQAYPKVYTSNNYYHFQYTNPYDKNSGVDWNDWGQ